MFFIFALSPLFGLVANVFLGVNFLIRRGQGRIQKTSLWVNLWRTGWNVVFIGVGISYLTRQLLQSPSEHTLLEGLTVLALFLFGLMAPAIWLWAIVALRREQINSDTLPSASAVPDDSAWPPAPTEPPDSANNE